MNWFNGNALDLLLAKVQPSSNKLDSLPATPTYSPPSPPSSSSNSVPGYTSSNATPVAGSSSARTALHGIEIPASASSPASIPSASSPTSAIPAPASASSPTSAIPAPASTSSPTSAIPAASISSLTKSVSASVSADASVSSITAPYVNNATPTPESSPSPSPATKSATEDSTKSATEDATTYIITKQSLFYFGMMLFALLIFATLVAVVFAGHFIDILFVLVMIATFIYGFTEKKEFQQNVAGKAIVLLRSAVDEIATLVVVVVLLIVVHIYTFFVHRHAFFFSVLLSNLYIALAVILALDLFRHGFSINMNQNIGNYLYSSWDALHSDNKVEEAKPALQMRAKGAEVFNIPDNIYTYSDAQSVCTSLNSRLATYSEIESAYNDGSEFCNYGWSDDQMILFPTQKKTWEVLQTTKQKNSCGHPGVNGGFMEDTEAQFGANCFGMKPDKKEIDQISQSVPSTASQASRKMTQEEEERVKYYREHGDEIQVNSFNTDRWFQ